MVAMISTDARTIASPALLAPPPRPPATTATPPSETANPPQATGRATAWCQAAAMTATRTGAAPTSRAACVTLVRARPAFWIRTEPPSPAAPQASTCHRSAARSAVRSTAASRTAAASPNRATTSQPGGSHDIAALDSGTLVPQATPAAARAATARVWLVAAMTGRRLVFIPSSVPPVLPSFAVQRL